MDKNAKQDLIISGKGNASGGNYNIIIINGQGEINGDLDCAELKINGDCEIKGNVKTKSGKIMGRAIIRGNFKSNEFKIHGFSEIAGDVNVKEIKIGGENNIKGSINAERIDIKGFLKTGSDCNAEHFIAKGAFTIFGLLNAGNIDIDLYGASKAKEIGGERITVKKGKSFKFIQIIKSIFLASDVNFILTTDTIEGDDVYLEYTKAKEVRGNNINIGPGCDIVLVEYKNNFHQVDESRVKVNKKV